MQVTIDEQFQPKTTLIGFLFYNAGLVNKISSRFRSTESTIIRRHRSAAPDDLTGDYVSAAGMRKRVGQIKNTQPELFRPLFHFVLIHGVNRKSLLDHVDVAFHVEVLLGNFVMFAIENFFEPANRLRN